MPKKLTSKEDLITKLPNDILLQIFSYLIQKQSHKQAHEELLKLKLVCSGFKDFIETNAKIFSAINDERIVNNTAFNFKTRRFSQQTFNSLGLFQPTTIKQYEKNLRTIEKYRKKGVINAPTMENIERQLMQQKNKLINNITNDENLNISNSIFNFIYCLLSCFTLPVTLLCYFYQNNNINWLGSCEGDPVITQWCTQDAQRYLNTTLAMFIFIGCLTGFLFKLIDTFVEKRLEQLLYGLKLKPVDYIETPCNQLTINCCSNTYFYRHYFLSMLWITSLVVLYMSSQVDIQECFKSISSNDHESYQDNIDVDCVESKVGNQANLIISFSTMGGFSLAYCFYTLLSNFFKISKSIVTCLCACNIFNNNRRTELDPLLEKTYNEVFHSSSALINP